MNVLYDRMECVGLCLCVSVFMGGIVGVLRGGVGGLEYWRINLYCCIVSPRTYACYDEIVMLVWWIFECEGLCWVWIDGGAVNIG